MLFRSIAWRSEVIAPEDYQKLLDSYLDERIQQDEANNAQKRSEERRVGKEC